MKNQLSIKFLTGLSLLIANSTASAFFGSADSLMDALAKEGTSLTCNIDPKTRARLSESFLKSPDVANWLWEDDSRGNCMGNQKLWIYLHFSQNYPKQPASDIDVDVSTQNASLGKLGELSAKATLTWKQMLACGAKNGLSDEQVRRRYVIGNAFCGDDKAADAAIFSDLKDLKTEVSQFLNSSEISFDENVSVHPLLSEMVLQAIADNASFYAGARRRSVNAEIFINATNYFAKSPKTCSQWGLFPVISKEILRSARVTVDMRIPDYLSIQDTLGGAIYRATEHCDPKAIGRINARFENPEIARTMIVGVRGPNASNGKVDQTISENRAFLGMELQSISHVYQAEYVANTDDGSSSLEIRKSVRDKFSVPKSFKAIFSESRLAAPDILENK